MLYLLPLIVLWPVARMSTDWLLLSDLPEPSRSWASSRGFDWIEWQDDDGAVRATYVFPSGTAYQAGLRRGDVLYELEYQQFYSATDLKRAVEGITAGSVRTYTVQRDTGLVSVDVVISEYPTFLYPLSTALWYASLWCFMAAAFLHLLALIVVLPLALRTRVARLPGLLILASALWIFGNLSRLVWLEVIGPPELDRQVFTIGFELLTLIALAGWCAFPVLMLETVLSAGNGPFGPLRFARLWIWLPAIVLGVAAIATTFSGSIGPVSLGALIGPILFYVTCYVVASTGLLAFRAVWGGDTRERRDWMYWGSLVVFCVALPGALIVQDVVPLLGGITDATAGWLVLSLQLISVAPVGLYSFDTLRYGKLDQALTRVVGYLSAVGLLFFAFTGAMYGLQPYMERFAVPDFVVGGLVVVTLFVLFERLVRWLQPYAEAVFASERVKARKRLASLANEMRVILGVQELARTAIDAVVDALAARSGLLFLKSQRGHPLWVEATVHPEPPFLTQHAFGTLWPHFEEDARLWALEPEINESALALGPHRLLVEHGAHLAVPVVGDRSPFGLLVLGRKTQRRAVYNLEDLDLIRSVCAQLALALERIHLVEREKELIRISAEANLTALRAQINPHFLFNTLNTIASLIEEDPMVAEQTVEHLAAIFRHILQTGSQPFVGLQIELRLVRHYLAIESARFGDRLQVAEAIDPELTGLQIPAFSIQTLVENAVQHGIAKRREGGTLSITARQTEDGAHAEIVIADSGVGIPALFGDHADFSTSRAFFGLGLSNVAQRLEHLFQREDLLAFRSNPETGTTVRMVVPHPTQGGTPGDR